MGTSGIIKNIEKEKKRKKTGTIKSISGHSVQLAKQSAQTNLFAVGKIAHGSAISPFFYLASSNQVLILIP